MTVIAYHRWSTDEQESGDSLARQSRSCQAFAASHGWTISETLIDRGHSAYKGEQMHPDAALGGFVASVERGEVAPGTILLAERLDRLSRRPVGEAMAWLHRLTTLGVEVAIADKGKVFGARPSTEEFIGNAISMAQSFEESDKKSERILSAKRRMWELAKNREGKWTNLCARPPLWLSRTPRKDGWITNEERAEIVRNIYQWSADGLGSVLVAAKLNRQGIPPWGVWRRHDPTWGRTAIRQMISNFAVEGDYVAESGEHSGRVIHDFFPRIVDADVVRQARVAQISRRKVAGERVSTGTANLWSGLTQCDCGKPAYMTSNKAKNGRTYRYLRCEGAAEGRSCENTDYFRYDKFEATALDLCLDLALDDRFFATAGALKVARIQHAEITKQIEDRRKARARLLTFVENDAADEQVVERISTLRNEIEDLGGRLKVAQQAVDDASGKVAATEHLKRVADIREASASADPAIREQARSKLRKALAAITNSLVISHCEGERVLTLTLMGGVMAVRIDAKGKVIRAISEVGGKPLSDILAPEQQAMIKPLIRRIKAA